jgi:hypothetical protein
MSKNRASGHIHSEESRRIFLKLLPSIYPGGIRSHDLYISSSSSVSYTTYIDKPPWPQILCPYSSLLSTVQTLFFLSHQNLNHWKESFTSLAFKTHLVTLKVNGEKPPFIHFHSTFQNAFPQFKSSIKFRFYRPPRPPPPQCSLVLGA